ncbi:MAG: hypothetical protein WAM60_23745 [Candidatus Promineifilaceae bacterium]
MSVVDNDGISAEQGVLFEESPERLKVTIPVKVNWVLFSLHSLALGIWLVMVALIIIYLVQGLSNSFVLTLLILLWTVLWLWFGRFLWNRWQYYAANREILFIDKEQLIVRRPMSILGITNAYDFKYVSPFYYSDNHHCVAFDYAYAHVYFGQSLEEPAARAFIAEINGRYFPEEEDE